MQTRILVLLVFALIVAIFAVMNIQPVVIDFFFGQTEIPLIFVIITSILIGAVFMFSFSSYKQLKMGRKIKVLERENNELKDELLELKGSETGEESVEPDVQEPADTEQIIENGEKDHKQD